MSRLLQPPTSPTRSVGRLSCFTAVIYLYAVASRPTAGRLVRGLSDRLSVVQADGQPAPPQRQVASCRHNISTYAPIHATTREYIAARKIPYMEEIYL